MNEATIQQLNQIAGHTLELTVRGEREFTFSFDAADAAAGERLANFFRPHASAEVHVDAECGTFVYIKA